MKEKDEDKGMGVLMETDGTVFEVVQARDLSALKQCVLENPKVMGEVNGDGVPAIHIAAETGDLEMMKYIIEYAIVNPCILDKQGNTILHYAVKSGNPELVKYLVERGGMFIDQANLLGVTAFDLAEQLSGEGAVSMDAVECVGAAGCGEGANRQDICAYFEEYLGVSPDELYHNPIRRGMHPDPSIVRVGEDYYMVNSSFVLFPCIPVSHSRDLLHWEVIGHAITNPEWARLKDLEGGRGYWAPDISYYEGRFYITATYRLNDGGGKLRYQMVTSSDKPEGPYCEPVFLDEDGIDPSIFTDEDGRRYMLLNRGARIFEISPDGREILSEPKLLWYGHNKKASEGPHLLYKDGCYYLFMAEGGTGAGHRISVARSKSLMGVYESCPYNPILRQWDEERQLQCCGHGKPVQTAEGDWYIVYLCNRFGTAGYGILGRETAMDPITWTADGWPIVNSLKGPSDLQRKPRIGNVGNPMAQNTSIGTGWGNSDLSDDGEASDANLWSQWSTVRGGTAESYEIKETDAGRQILIHGNGLDLNTLDYATILLQPQQDFSFEMTCKVTIGGIEEMMPGAADENVPDAVRQTAVADWDAGLTCYYDENSYLKLSLANRQGAMGILAAEYVGDGYVTEKFIPLDRDELLAAQSMQGEDTAVSVGFRIVTENLKRSLYYCVGVGYTEENQGESAAKETMQNNDLPEEKRIEWKTATVLENTSYLSSEGLSKGKRFTGAMAGIYVHGNVTVAFEGYRMM